ncbi:MAG: hypothetical protein LH649_15615 [Pseudanabaena sp. CAN_BIN31]|nr:hypothetical protein [Pseudanabaena sp. CAN_BIN31]
MNSQVDWKLKVAEIREKCNLPSPERNVGIAICLLDGEFFEIFAVSGKQSYNGVQNPTPAVRIFHLLDPPPGHYRGMDSEYKILENIASRYTQNKKVKGTIKLYTERKPCASCQDVISQFRKMFLNIDVIVESGDL